MCVAAALGCGASEGASPDDTRSDDYVASDYPEDMLLPRAGDWLDAPKALAGVGQFDRLRGTIHDDAKCSTMVAVAAAIVGGRARFLTFLDAIERLRAGRAEDLATVARVRQAVTDQRLTPRHLHELTEAVVRAYQVANGAFDGQIARMVRASGYTSVRVGATKAAALVDELKEGEVVPIGTIADNEAHITLLWKDARGVVRLYDSDDLRGHVLPRGSAMYRARVEDPRSEWLLAEKFR